MDYNSLYTTYDCHNWHKFFPTEEHYINVDPNIIYALNKVDDVYHAFSNARFNGYMLENNDYGDMISKNDQINLSFVHSRFLMNALNFYYFAIDLSWQVMFKYSLDNSYYFLCDQKEYDKYSNSCNYDNLTVLLNYRKEEELLEILKEFSTHHLVLELRSLYNYMKHKGTIHFEGLGEQYSAPIAGVKIGNEDITYRLFVKREQNIEELKNKLITLDMLFFNYFNGILDFIVPKDYFSHGFDFDKHVNLCFAVKKFKDERFDQYKIDFRDFYGEIISIK